MKALGLAVVALVGASVAYAGTPSADAAPAADAPASDAPGAGVQDIVVTAQRRTQSIQNVPMTLQALTGRSPGNVDDERYFEAWVNQTLGVLARYTNRTKTPENQVDSGAQQ